MHGSWLWWVRRAGSSGGDANAVLGMLAKAQQEGWLVPVVVRHSVDGAVVSDDGRLAAVPASVLQQGFDATAHHLVQV